jgi:putative inorganic carbon (hco3(-)) transporter
MSGTLDVIGCLLAAASLSASFLAPSPRVRAGGLVLAGALALALIAGQGWDDIRSIREHHVEFAGLIVAGIVVLAVGAAAMLRWPILLPLLLIAALPFRVRLHVTGGEAVNLLVPLYVVIGCGVVATLVATMRGETTLRRLPKPLVVALVAIVSLYALQTIYSPDVAFAARNVGFFLIPFAILFSLLAEASWDRRLLKLALGVLVAEGLILALIGIGQFADHHIFWNGKLETSNDFHFYFRVNSLFWDPNIFGRYLVLTILLATTTLLWAANRVLAFALAAAVAIAFTGLVFAFSQTSFIALFAGLLVLVALRWSVRRTAAATLIAVVLVGAGLLVRSSSDSSSTELNTEGHGTLVSGGLDLARNRPLYGYGSASFSKEFAREKDVPPGDTTISHSEPVTVAAEQGAIGVIAYVGLLAAALWTVLGGMPRAAPGWGGRFRSLADGDRAELIPARIGIAAAFCALFVHTIGYAAYLTDPLTWALLAVGGVLAAEVGAGEWPGSTSGGTGRQSPD